MATVEFAPYDGLVDTDPSPGPVPGGGPEGGARPEPGREPVTYRAPSRRALRKIMRRRSNGIRAAIGPNGSGKTAVAVMDLLPLLIGDGLRWKCTNPAHLHTKRGQYEGTRRILSTVQILDPMTGYEHPLCDRLTEWTQVLEAEHCDILFDEVTGIAGARESMGLPVVVQNVLQQLRRRDVHLTWTAPSWKRADAIIRSCTQIVTDCRGWLPDRSSLRGATPAAWLPRRLFKARTFSALDFEEWTAAKADQTGTSPVALRPILVQWWWGPGSMVFAAYDTYDAVSRVGEVLDGGRCAHCGGRRAVPACKCDH